MRQRPTSRRKIFPPPPLNGSWDNIVGIAHRCRPDGSNPDGVRFSTTFQTGPRPISLLKWVMGLLATRKTARMWC